MFDELFTDENPEPGLEDEVDGFVKQASQDEMTSGFYQAWGEFLKTAVDQGWATAHRQISLMDKTASHDPYRQGQIKVAEMVEDVGRYPETWGWYDFIKEARKKDDVVEFAKEAQARLPRENVSRREFGYAAATEAAIDDDGNITKMAWDGPKLIKESELDDPPPTVADGEMEFHDTSGDNPEGTDSTQTPAPTEVSGEMPVEDSKGDTPLSAQEVLGQALQ